MHDERALIRSSSLYKKLKRLVIQQEKEMGEACGLTDVLADLRHIADERGQEFFEQDRIAHDHYLAELESAREARKERERQRRKQGGSR